MIYLSGSSTHVRRLHDCGYRVGWMLGPKDRHRHLRLPYAIDNGRYHPPGGEPPYDDLELYKILRRMRGASWHLPLFAVVPDVPYEAEATRLMGCHHVPILREEYPDVQLALAVQDGMLWTPLCDTVDAIFVGGSTAWKWDLLGYWSRMAASCGKWLHVGRVNSQRGLFRCFEYGADSADGSGLARFHDEMRRRLMPVLQQGCLWGRAGR